MAYTVVGNKISGDPDPSWAPALDLAAAKQDTFGRMSQYYLDFVVNNSTTGTATTYIRLYFEHDCIVNFRTSSDRVNKTDCTPNSLIGSRNLTYNGTSYSGNSSSGSINMQVWYIYWPYFFFGNGTVAYTINGVSPPSKTGKIKEGSVTPNKMCLGSQEVKIYLGSLKVWG